MQQETPQVGPPILPPPSLPPQPPVAPQHPEQNFYQPSSQPDHPAPLHEAFDGHISWEASEYVHIDKGSNWLIGLLAIALVLLGVAIWLHEWTFAVLVVVMAIAMGVFAFRPPRVLHYRLTDDGVEIAGKLYHYQDFRAFGVMEDGAFYTMTFIPIKRFAPALSVYFAEVDGERIVDTVGDHLPMEHVEPDLIDTIMRRLRF